MEDFFMCFSMPNVDPLTQVLSTKPAEVVQEACQVLEKHGCPVKKELKSELYYSSTLCQVVFQVLHYANLIVTHAPTAQTDLQMCTHTHTYLSHPTPNTHTCIYPTPPPNTHTCTYPTPPPTHTHVLIPLHPQHIHMYLSHSTPQHRHMYLSHPTPQHTHMYLSHPPNTHMYLSHPPPPPTHTHVFIPPTPNSRRVF